MSLELSLYDLDKQLTELWAMREEVEDRITAIGEDWGGCPDIEAMGILQSAQEEARVLDEAMVLYFAALPKKVDSTADAWRALERLCGEPKERKGEKIYCELDLEISRLKERRDGMRKRLESLKTRVQFVMEGMAWPTGKPRKLEGARHSIYLKTNGGRPGVEITDETLVPDELTVKTLTLTPRLWQEIINAVCDSPQAKRVWPLVLEGVKESTRVPSLSLIAEALAKPCLMCGSHGVVCSHCHGFDDYCGDVAPCEYCRGSRMASTERSEPCPDCGGSGHASVPGARLKPVGSHVECK